MSDLTSALVTKVTFPSSSLLLAISLGVACLYLMGRHDEDRVKIAGQKARIEQIERYLNTSQNREIAAQSEAKENINIGMTEEMKKDAVSFAKQALQNYEKLTLMA